MSQNSTSMIGDDIWKETLDRDSLQMVLSYLPFVEKVKCLSVSRYWNEVATSALAHQKALGTRPTYFRHVDICHDKSHHVTLLDVVPFKVLANKEILPKTLSKCPHLKSIVLIASANDTEPSESEQTEADPELSERQEREGEENEMVELPVEWEEEPNQMVLSLDFHGVSFVHIHRRDLRSIFEIDDPTRRRMMLDTFRERQNRSREIREKKRAEKKGDDYLKVLAQYAPELECIEMSGWKKYTSSNEWLEFATSLKDTLVHFKAHHLLSWTINSILQALPRLTDLSVRVDLTSSSSMHISRLSRLSCLATASASGLSSAIQSATMKHLNTLFLINAERTHIRSISENFPQLRSLSLLMQSTISAENLYCLSKLTNLSELHLKYRYQEQPEYWQMPFLKLLKLTSLTLVDISMKNDDIVETLRSQHQLKYFLLRTQNTNLSKLNARVLSACHNLPLLQVVIEYPNICSEDHVIELIVKCSSLRLLKLHGCEEIVPRPEILLMAQKTAMKTKDRSLIIDIDTPEKIEIHPRIFQVAKSAYFPQNLHITISTAVDFFSTHMNGRLTFSSDDVFSEHSLYMSYL